MVIGGLAEACGERVEAVVRASDAPGVAVTVLMDGRTLLDVGVGHADMNGARPADARLSYPLYSITKLVLATAVMALVEQGRLRLDSAVVELVPGFSCDDAIELEHLLNHTSGLPDYGALPEYANGRQAHAGRAVVGRRVF